MKFKRIGLAGKSVISIAALDKGTNVSSFPAT